MPENILKEFRTRFPEFSEAEISTKDGMCYLLTHFSTINFDELKWLNQWNTFSGIHAMKDGTIRIEFIAE